MLFFLHLCHLTWASDAFSVSLNRIKPKWEPCIPTPRTPFQAHNDENYTLSFTNLKDDADEGNKNDDDDDEYQPSLTLIDRPVSSPVPNASNTTSSLLPQLSHWVGSNIPSYQMRKWQPS